MRNVRPIARGDTEDQLLNMRLFYLRRDLSSNKGLKTNLHTSMDRRCSVPYKFLSISVCCKSSNFIGNLMHARIRSPMLQPTVLMVSNETGSRNNNACTDAGTQGRRLLKKQVPTSNGNNQLHVSKGR